MNTNSLVVNVRFPIVDSVHDLPPLEQAVFSMVDVCEDLHIFALPKRFRINLVLPDRSDSIP